MKLGLVIAGGLLLLSGPGSMQATELAAVSIVDLPRAEAKWGYAPATRRIAPGSWVTWSNSGQDAHSVTAVDGTFDSGELQPSEGFAWYFADPGTFAYLCTLHPWMTGRIVIGSSVAPGPVPTGDLALGEAPVEEPPADVPTDDP